jgi:hypothetical protein
MKNIFLIVLSFIVFSSHVSAYQTESVSILLWGNYYENSSFIYINELTHSGVQYVDNNHIEGIQPINDLYNTNPVGTCFWWQVFWINNFDFLSKCGSQSWFFISNYVTTEFW